MEKVTLTTYGTIVSTSITVVALGPRDVVQKVPLYMLLDSSAKLRRGMGAHHGGHRENIPQKIAWQVPDTLRSVEVVNDKGDAMR